MLKFSPLVFLLSSSFPAFAGETAWQLVAPGAKLRLISSDVKTSGNKTMLALELTMPTTSSTYWRVPGESGIPLRLDFSQSSGVRSYQILWPFPFREVNRGYLDYVYRGDIVLPIELEVEGETPVITLEVFMGVCSDICVPVTVNFDQQLDFAQRDRDNAIRITQALAQVPIPWDQDINPVRALAFDLENQQVLVELSDENTDFSSMILATANSSIVFGPPQKSQIEGIIAFDKLGRGGDAELIGKPLTITFMSSSGPYELVHFPVALSQLGG